MECERKPTRITSSAAGGSGSSPTNSTRIQTAIQNLVENKNANQRIRDSFRLVMTGTQKRPVRLWTEAFLARNNRLAYDEKTQATQPAPLVGETVHEVRKAIYSDWLSCLRGTSHSSEL